MPAIINGALSPVTETPFPQLLQVPAVSDLSVGIFRIPGETMKLSRRSFALSLAGAPYVIRAQQQQPLRARVKIDTERVIGDIDPLIYGTSSSTWAAASMAASSKKARRCRTPTASAPRRVRCRPQAKRDASPLARRKLLFELPLDGRSRTPRPPSAPPGDGLGKRWRAIASARMSFSITRGCWARSRTSAPISARALGLEAQQWVEYCNSSEDTGMTRLRKQNGRQDPWKVVYWGLGNEMDGPWQMGHRSAKTTASSRWKRPS